MNIISGIVMGLILLSLWGLLVVGEYFEEDE